MSRTGSTMCVSLYVDDMEGVNHYRSLTPCMPAFMQCFPCLHRDPKSFVL